MHLIPVCFPSPPKISVFLFALIPIQSSSSSSAAATAGMALGGAAGDVAPRIGRGGGVLSAREAKALVEARSRMTEAMIPALHPLLTRFGESSERAQTLLQIPRCMDLEIYTTGRHQRQLDLLLQCVEVIPIWPGPRQVWRKPVPFVVFL